MTAAHQHVNSDHWSVSRSSSHTAVSSCAVFSALGHRFRVSTIHWTITGLPDVCAIGRVVRVCPAAEWVAWI